MDVLNDRQPDPKVLVVRLSSLGDVVLTTPVYRSLKAAWPDCRIEVLVKPAFAPALVGHPDVDAVVPFLGFSQALGRIRAGGYTHLLDLHATPRSLLLAAMSGVPRRARVAKAALARRLFVWFRRGSGELARHTVDRYLDALGPWGIAAADRAPRLHPGPSAAVRDRLEREGLRGRRLVGMHPGAIWPTKRWPAERFAALARRLSEDADTRVLLVGGPQDGALCAAIARAAATPRCSDWGGGTPLRELLALMPELSLFVTNDTGPMHVAAACGVPTAAVFGPTARALGFFPLGPRARVLEADLPCRPCTLHGDRACPQGHFLCMRLLTVDRVLAVCRELLRAPAPDPGPRPPVAP